MSQVCEQRKTFVCRDRMLEELDDDLDRTDNTLKGVMRKVDRALKLSDGQSRHVCNSGLFSNSHFCV